MENLQESEDSKLRASNDEIHLFASSFFFALHCTGASVRIQLSGIYG